jgi:hypothetical protein
MQSKARLSNSWSFQQTRPVLHILFPDLTALAATLARVLQQQNGLTCPMGLAFAKPVL